jgi:2-polyprenyl-3-methyl-5-hydroxy-6-metoxy-1,4-benzoquinol methylase
LSLYEDKKLDYFSICREDLISLIPNKTATNRVLEIGAGAGLTLRRIKELGYAQETVGVDVADLPQVSRSNADRFYVSDIEDETFSLGAGYFDVILCGDVIEHLRDPWRAVARVVTWLRPAGVLIASIPNLREKSILKRIALRGDFTYEDRGTLDRSHLRFFCRRNMIELFERSGLKVVRVATDLDPKKLTHPRVWQNKLTFGLLEEFFVTQYLFVAEKPAPTS